MFLGCSDIAWIFAGSFIRVGIFHRAATAIDFQGAKADLFKTKGGHFCLVKNIRF